MAGDVTDCQSELDALSGFLRERALGAASLNTALVYARLYGRLHWDNISGFFGDEELEQALFAKWRDALTEPVSGHKPVQGGWCHVLTRIYAGGGHTRLFRTLVGGIGGQGIAQSVILTQKSPAEAVAKLPAHLGAAKVLSGSPAERARAVYASARGADVVLLHNHPDDIGAALAARALQAEGVRVLFVNHADHVFSFGPGAADAVLEICATGWKTTRGWRSARSQQFMGIPIVAAGHQVPERGELRDGPVLSIGGPGKFAPSPELSFPEFLDHFLPLVPNDVVLIGPSSKDAWWQPVLEKYPGRLHLMGVQPPEVLQQQYQTAACYVDSFPLDGGTVFPEAVMAGLPAFALNQGAAPGVSPTDALRRPTMEDMAADLAAYLNGGAYPYDIAAVRGAIAADFSIEAVTERVMLAAKGQIVPPPQNVMELGNRSSDYNADRWRAVGRLNVPKRIWRQLPLVEQISSAVAVRKLPLSRKTAGILRRRCILG